MRKKLIYLALSLALLCAALPASADLLFTRQDNSYANTALGIIQGAGAPVSPLVSNMGGNAGQGIYQFKNAGGDYRIAVTLYSNNATDVISIYAPGKQSTWANQSSWGKPLREAATTLQNTRGVALLNGYLYAAAYDVPAVNRISTAGDVYTQDKAYQHSFPGTKYDCHGEAIVTWNNSVYAIFTGADNPWDTENGSYRLNQLVKFDGDLKVVSAVDMTGKNIDGFTPGAYTESEGVLYAASLGGVQQFGDKWNPQSCVEMADLSTMKVASLVTAEAMNKTDPSFKHMFDAIAVAGDKVYIQAARWTSGEDYTPGYNIRIYETTVEKLKAGDIGVKIKEFTGSYGYRLGLVYDASTKYLWAGVGYSLWRYDGTAWSEFDSNALKGNVSAYTVVSNGDTPVGDEPVIMTSSLASGVIGSSYSAVLSATGAAPITWSVTAGTLPSGLSLNGESGAITGVPTTAGTSAFTVKAKNSVGSVEKELSITVTSGGSGSGGGGGCSAGFGALALLALLPAARRCRRRTGGR